MRKDLHTLDDCFYAVDLVVTPAGGVFRALRNALGRRRLLRIAERYAYLLARPGGETRPYPSHCNALGWGPLLRDLAAAPKTRAIASNPATLRERRQNWARTQRARFTPAS